MNPFRLALAALALGVACLPPASAPLSLPPASGAVEIPARWASTAVEPWGAVAPAALALELPPPPVIAPERAKDVAPPLPLPAPPPRPRAAVPRPQAKALEVPVPRANFLRLPTTGFERQLLLYSDCRNHADMGYATGYFDTCYGGRTVLIGHNPGPFNAVARLNVGDPVMYWDPSGALKTLSVTNKKVVPYSDAPEAVARDESAVVFYACYTPDGNSDWVIDAN